MKRSEMLNKLEREFKCQLREDCVIGYKELAFNILYFLEANGMKPPRQKEIPEEAEEPSHPHYFGKYEWESEDE